MSDQLQIYFLCRQKAARLSSDRIPAFMTSLPPRHVTYTDTTRTPSSMASHEHLSARVLSNFLLP